MKSSEKSPEKESSSSSPKRSIVAGEFSQKSRFLCNFCGGKKCRHENYLNHQNPAIKGLNSDWITPRILAMQRPSSRLIKEFGIIDQFKTNSIRAVFCLQEPGEHANCGDGLRKESGFSYLPEEFFENGIFFYNFHWKDMSNTDYSNILKILSMIEFTYQNDGKIAVHCHAGKGRTAVVVCAWLIYNDRMDASDAIKLFKSKRAGSLGKEKQRNFLEKFQNYCIQTRKTFFTQGVSISSFIKNQNAVIFAELKQETRNIPLIILLIINIFQERININDNSPKAIFSAFSEGEYTDNLMGLKEKINLLIDIKSLLNEYENKILVQLLIDFCEDFEQSSISESSIQKIYRFMTSESVDFVNIFQTQGLLEKHEFYLMNLFVKLADEIVKRDQNCKSDLTTYFLRISLFLLKKTKNYNGVNKKEEMNKDETLKKIRQIMWLWFAEINACKDDSQINEIEQAFKGASSPVLVKKSIFADEEGRKRAYTEKNPRVIHINKVTDEEEKGE